MLAVQLGDGVHHRVVVVDVPTDANKLSEPVPLSSLAAAASRVADMDFRPRDPIWLSRFSDETRLAEHYRKGRILLSGDAAHIHSPMGGQGMNVGIQDAMNLGWKLASVLRDAAPEELFVSYERERCPVREVLRRNTLAQLALFSSFDPSCLVLRGTLENFIRVPEVNRQLSDEVSGSGAARRLSRSCPPRRRRSRCRKACRLRRFRSTPHQRRPRAEAPDRSRASLFVHLGVVGLIPI
jgi:2-polyprenyl-6-methoxyphenol hydroxylase-like FAD-dependent oxidoreductase